MDQAVFPQWIVLAVQRYGAQPCLSKKSLDIGTVGAGRSPQRQDGSRLPGPDLPRRCSIVRAAPRRAASSNPSMSINIQSGSSPVRAQKSSMVITGTVMRSVTSSILFCSARRLIPSASERYIVVEPIEDPTALFSMLTIGSKPLNCTCADRTSTASGFGSKPTTLPVGPVQCDNCNTYAPTFAPTSKQIASRFDPFAQEMRDVCFVDSCPADCDTAGQSGRARR